MRKLSITNTVALCGIAALFAAVLMPKRNHQGQMPDRFQRIATALEAYALDNGGKYPPDRPDPNNAYLLSTRLTTPLAYLAPGDMIDPLAQNANISRIVRYINFDNTYGESEFSGQRALYPQYYALHGSWMLWSGRAVTSNPSTNLFFDMVSYDPTNGALSLGTVFRSQRHLSETTLKPIGQ